MANKLKMENENMDVVAQCPCI